MALVVFEAAALVRALNCANAVGNNGDPAQNDEKTAASLSAGRRPHVSGSDSYPADLPPPPKQKPGPPHLKRSGW